MKRLIGLLTSAAVLFVPITVLAGYRPDPGCTACTSESILSACPNLRAPSSYSPPFNGCGPMDLPDVSLIGGFLGQWGPVDFNPSCDNHDTCYGTCNTTKEGCDNTFLSQMTNACKKNYAGNLDNGITAIGYGFCNDLALSYYGLVAETDVGAEAFQEGQISGCECCTGSGSGSGTSSQSSSSMSESSSSSSESTSSNSTMTSSMSSSQSSSAPADAGTCTIVLEGSATGTYPCTVTVAAGNGTTAFTLDSSVMTPWFTTISINQMEDPPTVGTLTNSNCVNGGVEVNAPSPSTDDYEVCACNDSSKCSMMGCNVGSYTVTLASVTGGPILYDVHGSASASLIADPGGSGTGTVTVTVTF